MIVVSYGRGIDSSISIVITSRSLTGKAPESYLKPNRKPDPSSSPTIFHRVFAVKLRGMLDFQVSLPRIGGTFIGSMQKHSLIRGKKTPVKGSASILP